MFKILEFLFKAPFYLVGLLYGVFTGKADSLVFIIVTVIILFVTWLTIEKVKTRIIVDIILIILLIILLAIF